MRRGGSGSGTPRSSSVPAASCASPTPRRSPRPRATVPAPNATASALNATASAPNATASAPNPTASAPDATTPAMPGRENAAPAGRIAPDDPRTPDVRALLRRHLEFNRSHTPPADVHALDVSGLLHPAVTFVSFRRDGELLGVGALKRLDGGHAELKSMHTAEAARGRGIGRAILGHLIGMARGRGCHRVSLETGSMPAYAPARSLYASAGFVPCGPFGDYAPSPSSTFMTLALNGADPARSR